MRCVSQLKPVSVFCNLMIIIFVLIDSFKDHNHLQISESIINRQKLNNKLKKKP